MDENLGVLASASPPRQSPYRLEITGFPDPSSLPQATRDYRLAAGQRRRRALAIPRWRRENSVRVLPVHARVRGFTRLVARVRRLVGAVAAREAEEGLLRVDELVAGVVRGGVTAGVHPDRVARACFHAVAAEDAAKLVDDEADRESLVA